MYNGIISMWQSIKFIPVRFTKLVHKYNVQSQFNKVSYNKLNNTSFRIIASFYIETTYIVVT